MLAQRAQHRVGDIAHAGLNRQEAFRHAAGGDFGGQELGHVLPDLVGDGCRTRRIRRVSSSAAVSTTPAMRDGSTLITGEPMRSEAA